MLTDLAQNFAGYLHTYGAFALFVTITLEAAGLPTPGESALIAAIALTMTGNLNLLHVFAAAVLGAIIGDNIGYAVGRYAGRTAIARVASKFGITSEHLDHTESMLRKWGPGLIIVARFFPVLRQIGGIGAGSIGMSWPRFLAANTAGALGWVTMWVVVVRVLEPVVPKLIKAWHESAAYKFVIVASAIIFALAAVMVIRRLREHFAN
ncbi:MAG: DedA family protein [Hyphomicrobiaceae bacterium]|nr:DedA family protein [Hyphomicrobiaceae bacterium]